MTLRELRKSKDMTQEKFAAELQIGRATLSKYETGRLTMTFGLLKSVCDNFGVKYVLGAKGKPHGQFQPK